MPKAFQTATDGATVTFNTNLGFNWKVTLGGNRTLQFGHLEKGDEVSVLLIQDGTGNRTATWPSNVAWASGKAPALQSAANATDLFVFRYDGTSLREVSGGGGSRLPARITAIALATMTLVGGGSGIKYIFSNGNNQDSGSISHGIELRTKSGSQLNGIVSASGGVLSGSGPTVVGAVTDKPAQTLGSVVLRVRGGPKGTNASGSVILNGAKGGQVCYADTDGTGYTQCSANNGTVTCKTAVGNECNQL